MATSGSWSMALVLVALATGGCGSSSSEIPVAPPPVSPADGAQDGDTAAPATPAVQAAPGEAAPPTMLGKGDSCSLAGASAVPAGARGTVTVAGTFDYAEGVDSSPVVLLELLQRSRAGKWTRYDFVCNDPDGFQLTLPQKFGTTYIAAFLDRTGNGPDETDAAAITAEALDVAEADVAGVALRFEADADFGDLERPLFHLEEEAPAPELLSGEQPPPVNDPEAGEISEPLPPGPPGEGIESPASPAVAPPAGEAGDGNPVPGDPAAAPPDPAGGEPPPEDAAG